MDQGVGRNVGQERARIERGIDGRTLVSALADTVARLGDAPALHWRDASRWHDPSPGGWQTLSWSGFLRQIRCAGGAFRALGMSRGDFVVFSARNHPAHLIADQAAMHLGATPVSLYPTLSVEQLAFHAEHCGARIAVVEGPGLLDRALAVARLERIVAVDAPSDDPRVLSWETAMELGRDEDERDPGAFGAGAARVQPDDLATLIYTSGTTGQPKAVMVTHRMALWIEASLRLVADIGPEDRLVSYLPMAHIAERFLSAWQPAVRGAESWLCPDPLYLPVALTEVQPTWFFGVPRIWEKYASMLRPAWDQAEAAGRGPATAPMLLERCGLHRCRVAFIGGAPIDPDVLRFFRRLGIEVSEMWGMAEFGPGTWNGVENVRIGTVGVPMPGVEVELAPDGELLVRGGNVTRGYFRDPDATAEAIDADGWMHTGDVATVDRDGYFRIVDRKKEIIITAGGKNVSPATLESLVKRHPLVAEVCVVGDRRPYPSALVVLDRAAAMAWAGERGIRAASLSELAAHPAVLEEVQKGVDVANRMVSRPEQIKRFTILPTEWTPESEEMSPTLKLKRRLIQGKYAAEIEALYR
jgi:long-subunit acyl-CoA synthetase (AMP-forming)